MFYTGEGQFTDRGWLNYSGRYVIDLGPVNLAAPGSYTYKLSGMPQARMVIGISVVEDNPNGLDQPRPEHPTRVRLELQNCENQIAILEEAPLDAWVHSYALRDTTSKLYRRGEARDIPLPGGGTRGELVGLKASRGWGTYFDSEPNCEYLLKFDVLASDHYIPRAARLVVDGWGRM